ncbi:MAG: hypothetical protein PHI11_08495 [Gallionella sp.]|nr:hypothetical protein [Gallionella sp.]
MSILYSVCTLHLITSLIGGRLGRISGATGALAVVMGTTRCGISFRDCGIDGHIAYCKLFLAW